MTALGKVEAGTGTHWKVGLREPAQRAGGDVACVDTLPLEGKWREFTGSVYWDGIHAITHVAYTVQGANAAGAAGRPALVYVHRECLGGERLGAFQCSCGHRVKWAHGQIRRHGHGIVIYLREHAQGEGVRRCRGTGPYSSGEATVVTQILAQQGFCSVELILGRVELVAALTAGAIEVKGQVQLVRPSNRQRPGSRRA